MSGRIPREFIDELMARSDVVEVVSSRVRLQKAGHEYKGLCPFHHEKTPSFTVSPAKQFYHCFGCGAHGTALSFLMEHDHMGFVDAVGELAAAAGLDVPRSADEAGATRRDTALYATLERAAAWYRQQLREHPPAIEYLRHRGISGETARDFGLGFAPDRWEGLLPALGGGGETRSHLVETGMVRPRRGGEGHYDLFRNRIMFPIRDARGRVIAFGGRVLDGSEPKYLNSPESPLFHKGRELYGLYEARRALRDIPCLLVVEGYTDTAALAEHGLRYAVATLGTSCTQAHLDRLFKLAESVVCCFDGDRAGRDAAWRALSNALPAMRDGRRMSFLFLPEGHDPDSLVRAEGADAFEARLKNALPLSEYLIEALSQQTDLDSVDGRARLVELCRPLLARLPDGVYREMLIERLARAVAMDGDRLAALLRPDEAPPRPRMRSARNRLGRGRGNLVRQAIALLVHYPGIAAQVEVPAGLAGLERKGMPILLRLLEDLARCPHITTGAVLERWRDHEAGPHLARLAAGEMLVTEEAARDELCHIIRRLAEESAASRRALLLEKERREGLDAEEQREFLMLLRQRQAPRDRDSGGAR